MNCRDAKQHILAFLDGELKLQDQQAMYQHLDSCEPCSDYLDFMGQMDSMLKTALTPVAPPRDFTQQLMLRLESEKDYCVAEDLERTDSSGEKSRKRWIPSLANGWMKTVVAASIAMVMLVGGMGLSGSAYMDESFAKRVFLISRDGISGIRRVVDNVITLAQDDKKDAENAPVTPPAKEEKVSETPPVEEILPGEEPDADEGDFDVALQEEENSLLNEDANGDSPEINAADKEEPSPQVSMTAIVSPVIVTQGTDNLRPVWVDNDTVFYLSEKRAPKEGTYVIWETDSKGITRRMVSAPGYCVSLENGGGVWSAYYNNYAFVTNQKGYWQVAYSSLKGQFRVAVDPGTTAVPAAGTLWEYSPAPSVNGEIAFLTKRFGNVDLMAADHEGNLRALAKTPEIESSPVWSPDGARIAFVRTASGSSDNRVIVADRNGKGATAVTPSLSKAKMVPAWSANGKQLAINVSEAGDKNGLWLVNSDGSNWRRITGKGGGNVVAWSPNGHLVAFTDAKSRLYVWDVAKDADDPKAIINVEPADQEGKVNYVSWSPDSKNLLLEWYGSQTKTKAIWRAEIINFK